jgi:hypothetical protein
VIQVDLAFMELQPFAFSSQIFRDAGAEFLLPTAMQFAGTHFAVDPLVCALIWSLAGTDGGASANGENPAKTPARDFPDLPQ